jgi:hypothetical protein
MRRGMLWALHFSWSCFATVIKCPVSEVLSRYWTIVTPTNALVVVVWMVLARLVGCVDDFSQTGRSDRERKEPLILTSRQSLLNDLYQIPRAQNGFCRVSHKVQRVVDLVPHGSIGWNGSVE